MPQAPDLPDSDGTPIGNEHGSEGEQVEFQLETIVDAVANGRLGIMLAVSRIRSEDLVSTTKALCSWLHDADFAEGTRLRRVSVLLKLLTAIAAPAIETLTNMELRDKLETDVAMQIRRCVKSMRKALSALAGRSLGVLLARMSLPSTSPLGRIALSTAADACAPDHVRIAALSAMEVAGDTLPCRSCVDVLRQALNSVSTAVVVKAVKSCYPILAPEPALLPTMGSTFLTTLALAATERNCKVLLALSAVANDGDARVIFDKVASDASAIFTTAMEDYLGCDGRKVCALGCAAVVLLVGRSKNSKGTKRIVDRILNFCFDELCKVALQSQESGESTVFSEADAPWAERASGAKAVLDLLTMHFCSASVVSQILNFVRLNVADSVDWRKRYAAVSVITYTTEGLAHHLRKHVTMLAEVITLRAADASPQVRHAVVCALSALAAELFPKFHIDVGESMGNLVLGLLKDEVPHVRLEASFALLQVINFDQKIGVGLRAKQVKKIYGKLAPMVMKSLLECLEVENIEAIRVQLIEDIGHMHIFSRLVPESLSPHLAKVIVDLVPLLRSDNASVVASREPRKLRAAALSTVTISMVTAKALKAMPPVLDVTVVPFVLAFIHNHLKLLVAGGSSKENYMNPLIDAVGRAAMCIIELEIDVPASFVEAFLQFLICFSKADLAAVEIESQTDEDSEVENDVASGVQMTTREHRFSITLTDEVEGQVTTTQPVIDGVAKKVIVNEKLVDTARLMFNIIEVLALEKRKSTLETLLSQRVAIIDVAIMALSSTHPATRSAAADCVTSMCMLSPLRGDSAASIVSKLLSVIDPELPIDFLEQLAAASKTAISAAPLDGYFPVAFAFTSAHRMFNCVLLLGTAAFEADKAKLHGGSEVRRTGAKLVEVADQMISGIIALLQHCDSTEQHLMMQGAMEHLEALTGADPRQSDHELTVALYLVAEIAEHFSESLSVEQLPSLLEICATLIDEMTDVHHVRVAAYILKLLSPRLLIIPEPHGVAAIELVHECLTNFLQTKSSHRPVWNAASANAVAAAVALMDKFLHLHHCDFLVLLQAVLKHLPTHGDRVELRAACTVLERWVEDCHPLLASESLAGQVVAKIVSSRHAADLESQEDASDENEDEDH